MITQKRALGDSGEEKAVQYLISKGYSIVARNYTTKFGEIDIIARNPAGFIVFVEVKTMWAGGFIRPEENITPQKLRRMVKAIGIFNLEAKLPSGGRWRIDGVFVEINDAAGECKVEHIENINIQ